MNSKPRRNADDYHGQWCGKRQTDQGGKDLATSGSVL